MLSVILCAAGKGERAGFQENKVLKEFCGMPLLCFSLSAFAPFADEILIAVRKEDELAVQKLLAPYPIARTVQGGATRMESVYLSLKKVKGDKVLVHDAARPFVSENLIQVCISELERHQSAVCALPASDTTVLSLRGEISSHLKRDTVYTLQTPQGFYTKELLSAFEKAYEEGETNFTDESGVYCRYIRPAHLFWGERENRKLTYPEDFSPCERAGFGVDTHAFKAEAGEIVLGGVHIPSPLTVIAHSDGDALCHALMDALLSALGERDIGYFFPDTDENFCGADSMKLLDIVMKMVDGSGFSVKSASISVLAEVPRLSPYIQYIKQNICRALQTEHVGVAAGTNEKLGYVGERKGLTVYALVLLTKKGMK